MCNTNPDAPDYGPCDEDCTVYVVGTITQGDIDLITVYASHSEPGIAWSCEVCGHRDDNRNGANPWDHVCPVTAWTYLPDWRKVPARSVGL